MARIDLYLLVSLYYEGAALERGAGGRYMSANPLHVAVVERRGGQHPGPRIALKGLLNQLQAVSKGMKWKR